MTVYIEKPAVNLREELASLRNQGGYQEQQFYFDNFVTNGTFDTDLTGWAISGDATVVGGEARIADVGGTDAYISQQLFGVATGDVLKVNFTQTAGTDLFLQFGSSEGDNLDEQISNLGVATHTIYHTAKRDNPFITFRSFITNSVNTIDNISVFEVDASNDVIYTMPKGWVPKDVFEDGLLQREGAANDYEVIYDGFDYVIKPAVAPSATTQTCVIGVRK
jgi:hypothetical protein